MTNIPIIPDHLAKQLISSKAYANLDGIHRVYQELRDTAPIGLVDQPGFDPFIVFSKHKDIKYISQNNDLFINNGEKGAGLNSQAGIAELEKMKQGMPKLRTIIQIDGEEHRKLRAVATLWLTPKKIQSISHDVRSIAKQWINKIKENDGDCDFVSDIALGYPLSIIRSILGVPEQDEPILLTMTQKLFAPNDPEINQDNNESQDKAASLDAMMQFFQYFASLTEQRRETPTTDVASVIANATIDGEPISDLDAISYYIALATAGHDTTSASISGAMKALVDNPQLLKQLQDEPSLIPAFIEEAIRMTTPIQSFMRTATVDIEISGQQIKKGDWLMLCYPSANRDEDVFDKPYTFDVSRGRGKHLAFGTGAHFCIGRHLASLEMLIFFEELLPLIASIEATGEATRIASIFIGGPKSLPIKIHLR